MHDDVLNVLIVAAQKPVGTPLQGTYAVRYPQNQACTLGPVRFVQKRDAQNGNAWLKYG